VNGGSLINTLRPDQLEAALLNLSRNTSYPPKARKKFKVAAGRVHQAREVIEAYADGARDDLEVNLVDDHDL
jgi:hypothetical protein